MQTDLASALASRRNTTPGIHPYATLAWARRDSVIKDYKTQKPVFSQPDVEVPVAWSDTATNILAQKYFRGNAGTPERETSLRQVADRIVDTIAGWGTKNGYFKDQEELETFSAELKYLIVHQHAAFNSPVWFNVGAPGRPQTVSACYILGINDSMESILNWYTEEGRIFQAGSGAGVNLSNLRGSTETLRTGGTASGPVSFMRGADASAGTIKSGGSVRRAAKMVVLDADHPDIELFIESKRHEEGKIRVLADAGYDMRSGTDDMASVQYQNANNSVRVTEAFMQAVQNDQDWNLVGRNKGDVIRTVKARDLFRKLCQAAWECADPGIQFETTINSWHTIPEAGPITASNPCSEFLSVDNSSCNLASINLAKYVDPSGAFDVEAFKHTVRLLMLAQDIMICEADFPTEKIGEVTRQYRQIGLGYANLGAVLMSLGYGYDSTEGRAWAAAVTSLMTATAYSASGQIAEQTGPFHKWLDHKNSTVNVLRKHEAAHRTDVCTNDTALVVGQSMITAATDEWASAIQYAQRTGIRNSQATLLAPTGTIGFVMDCVTTGIEPAFGLSTTKQMVGGGTIQVVHPGIPAALARLGYPDEDSDRIVNHLTTTGNIMDAPGLDPTHRNVFAAAIGDYAITPAGHINMMAAVQPFLSGAISKTVNLPETTTVEDIETTLIDGWKLGLKAIAVYRDNCKVGQPLSATKTDSVETPIVAPTIIQGPTRKKLGTRRPGHITKFEITGCEGYITVGEYEDGQPGELFINVSKQGSTLSGLFDSFAVAISLGLQHGVPLSVYVKKYIGQKFDPSGMTNDKDIRIAQSIVDWMFRRLALDYMSADERHELGIFSTGERAEMVNGSHEPASAEHGEPNHADSGSIKLTNQTRSRAIDVPLCLTCGTSSGQRRAGACWACESCGGTSGCS